jgi:UTP:GlnB (protein PII) uridylyltransferase
MSDTDKGELVMTIEASDRPGLLLAITRSLFRAGVQIVASEATTENGRVVDRFTLVELDGSPVTEKRRRALQTDVLAAIDAVAR